MDNIAEDAQRCVVTNSSTNSGFGHRPHDTIARLLNIVAIQLTVASFPSIKGLIHIDRFLIHKIKAKLPPFLKNIHVYTCTSTRTSFTSNTNHKNTHLAPSVGVTYTSLSFSMFIVQWCVDIPSPFSCIS